VGLEDGLFPNFSAMHDPKELEEERRLLYVAITRAEKKCYLTYALNRFRFGQNIYSSASPFIDEMDESYLEFSGAIYDRIQRRNYQNKTYQGNYGHQHKTSTIKDAGNKAPKTEVSSPPKTQKLVSVNSIKPDSNHTPLYDLKTGEWVEHEKFGIGEVKNIDGQVPNIKATIDFKNAGQKVILVKFARLKRVN
jgi:DNA helicase-2/ATP-dependent DNA helicase PcrA